MTTTTTTKKQQKQRYCDNRKAALIQVDKATRKAALIQVDKATSLYTRPTSVPCHIIGEKG